MHPRTPHSLFLILLLLVNCTGLPVWGQNPISIQILIIEGEGAINNIKQRVNREPIIQVEDENHKPVAGAAIIFFLPNDGPGGVFANGTSTLTTTTDAQGQAVARGIRFNSQVGSMLIRVAASYAGQTASAIITQTNIAGNVSTSGASGGGMSLSTKLLILGVIVGGGVAAGVLLGSRGGSSSTAATPNTITISPGTVTVGGPQ